jgi:hypothetical protein
MLAGYGLLVYRFIWPYLRERQVLVIAVILVVVLMVAFLLAIVIILAVGAAIPAFIGWLLDKLIFAPFAQRRCP